MLTKVLTPRSIRVPLLTQSVHVFNVAVSLGGVESLISHPASLSYAGTDLKGEEGVPDNLLRMR